MNGLPKTWIVEALRALDGSATALDVSRHVWSQHRPDLESAGDLLYLWQIELRSVAHLLAQSGELRIDGDTWMLNSDPDAPVRHPTRWDQDEIEAAVAAYLSMLRPGDDGRPARRHDALASLRQVTQRPDAAVDAMLSTISAVVQELGFDHLPAYPPRSNVQAGVRAAVRTGLAPPPTMTNME